MPRAGEDATALASKLESCRVYCRRPSARTTLALLQEPGGDEDAKSRRGGKDPKDGPRPAAPSRQRVSQGQKDEPDCQVREPVHCLYVVPRKTGVMYGQQLQLIQGCARTRRRSTRPAGEQFPLSFGREEDGKSSQRPGLRTTAIEAIDDFACSEKGNRAMRAVSWVRSITGQRVCGHHPQ